MPSAMNGDGSVHSTSPELGSAPGASGAMGPQTEALKQVLTVIEKKVRNMEKKKGKLEDYKSKKNRGESLNADQLEALSKAEEVTHNLDFARELQKCFLALGIDIQKAEKKACRRDQLRREELERRRLQQLLEVQLLLDQLGEEAVRQELSRPPSPGDHPLLTDAQLSTLDDFYKLVNPERDGNTRLAEQFEEVSMHMWELLEGKDKPVVGTTYKALKETMERVLQSGYFQRAHTHQNGVCEEEPPSATAAAAVAPSESSEAEEQPEPAVPEATAEQDYTEAVVDTKEFVNRQLLPEASQSNTQEEPPSEWSQEAEVTLHTQQQPPPHSEAPPVSAGPAPPAAATSDPVVRKQVVQDLMAQMQGTYNFMQDSILEFDGQVIDPAIVSVQSMSPSHSLERAQMVCSTVHSEAQLISQTSTVPTQPEVSLLSSPPEDFSSAAPLYPPPHTADPLQASLSLSSEQPPAPSLPSVSHPPPKVLHTGGINVNAAPFQSMTAVFNLNAPPMPSASEVEQQKLSSQYQSSFSPSYTSQPEEQTDMQPVVGSFHSQDALQAGGAHLSQQVVGQGPAYNRAGQPFFGTSRGGVMNRGAPRAARAAMNGYRGATNGYRGGYDGYRPPFPSAVGGNYGQTQFGNAPREYSNNNYQRDGYQQQGFKRGAGQSSRGVSRGRGGSFRCSRGMATHHIS